VGSGFPYVGAIPWRTIRGVSQASVVDFGQCFRIEDCLLPSGRTIISFQERLAFDTEIRVFFGGLVCADEPK